MEKLNLTQQKHAFTNQTKRTTTQNKHKKTKARFSRLLQHPVWKLRGPVRSNRGRDMAIFEFFSMAAAAILDFSNLKSLTVRRLKRAELRRRAKFGRNRPKRVRDMAIFRFFKMAAAAILDFSNFKFLTVRRLKRAELRRCAKCGRNRSKRG